MTIDVLPIATIAAAVVAAFTVSASVGALATRFAAALATSDRKVGAAAAVDD